MVALPPFQSLIDAHGAGVRRYLVSMLGPHDADDALQETWIAALRAYPGLRTAENLRGWLLTIAHRKAIDHARGRARRAIPVAAADDLAGADPRAVAALDGALTDPALWAGVRALPSKQRSAVALRFVADAAYREIAAAMGTSEEAARRNVYEGLTRLRKELHQ